MIKPRKVSSLIGRVMEADPKVEVIEYRKEEKSLYVQLRSAMAWGDLLDDIELPVSKKFSYTTPKEMIHMATGKFFVIVWDCSELGQDEPETGVGFSFDRGVAKRARRRVNEQEEEGARVIGGRRHVGSGAIPDLKSDASSKDWQQESKQTKHKSFGLKLDMLQKITREARVQDKRPMVFLRFTDIPDDMSVEDDWIIMPKSAFEEMEK